MVNRNTRIVFMGTPEFAVPSLQYLVEAGYPVVAVVTVPDKLGGRGMKQVLTSPIKTFAQENGIPVLQPTNLKSSSFLNELRLFQADLQVVVAFRMLPEAVWNMPSIGTLNLHGSLLPAYRGAAPIQRAIMAGEKLTGVTTFLLQHEIDTGNILLQQEVAILPDDDAGALHDRMMIIGARVIVSTVDLLTSGDIQPQPQDETKVSYAPKIHHEDGKIEWTEPVDRIYNKIRGLSPYPGAYTLVNGRECKIWRAKIYSNKSTVTPGQIRVIDHRLIVQTMNGELELLEIQLSGKKRMPARDIINGYPVQNWTMT
jgi:methionyl-tRNA formyltransferase